MLAELGAREVDIPPEDALRLDLRLILGGRGVVLPSVIASAAERARPSSTWRRSRRSRSSRWRCQLASISRCASRYRSVTARSWFAAYPTAAFASAYLASKRAPSSSEDFWGLTSASGGLSIPASIRAG
jgi:hypothetical protein